MYSHEWKYACIAKDQTYNPIFIKFIMSALSAYTFRPFLFSVVIILNRSSFDRAYPWKSINNWFYKNLL